MLRGAAKTTSLGIPLVAAMWSRSDDLEGVHPDTGLALHDRAGVYGAGASLHLPMVP